MPPDARIALIVEDIAHEAFVRSLARRIAKEEHVLVQFSTVSGRGGSGKAISELAVYQKALLTTTPVPSLLIVAIDANCKGWNTAHALITNEIEDSVFPLVAIGCPDPHVEKWYVADALALQEKYGKPVKVPKKKCARDIYKRLLIDYLVDTGNVVTIGGAEFADEIVTIMDFYRAGKSDAALKAFIDSVRGCLRIIKAGQVP
jgi:hypothetical protein